MEQQQNPNWGKDYLLEQVGRSLAILEGEVQRLQQELQKYELVEEPTGDNGSTSGSETVVVNAEPVKA